MKKTLVEFARSVSAQRKQPRRTITKQDVDLALAWAKSELTLKQVSVAWKLPASKGSAVYVYLAQALREHFTKK